MSDTASAGSDSGTETYRTEHRRDGTATLADEVVAAVSAVDGRPPEEIEPIYERVDPDALETLFAPRPGGARTGGAVEFSLSGHHVTVHGDGRIDVRAPA